MKKVEIQDKSRSKKVTVKRTGTNRRGNPMIEQPAVVSAVVPMPKRRLDAYRYHDIDDKMTLATEQRRLRDIEEVMLDNAHQIAREELQAIKAGGLAVVFSITLIVITAILAIASISGGQK